MDNNIKDHHSSSRIAIIINVATGRIIAVVSFLGSNCRTTDFLIPIGQTEIDTGNDACNARHGASLPLLLLLIRFFALPFRSSSSSIKDEMLDIRLERRERIVGAIQLVRHILVIILPRGG
jgi:hypothetical protein